MQPHHEPLLLTQPSAGSRRPHLREASAAIPGIVAGPKCSCGHGRQAHEHYRRGHDCALCACARFSRPLLVRLHLRG